ncbi:MAG: hypothetical protein IJT88_02530 [Kiritimatiellae bacterium]|nr:hypothetical protein [Kiritimatiellia bacterium]
MDTIFQKKALGRKVAGKGKKKVAAKAAAGKKSARKKKPGRKPGPMAGLTPRQRAAERKRNAELLERFERFCDGLAEGKTHEVVMGETSITWPEVRKAWNLDEGAKARYQNARTLGAEVRKALVEDEMFRRGMDGNLEQAATPEGAVVTLRKPADRVLIRVFDEDHAAKQDVKITGDVSLQMLRDAMRAGEEGNAQ